MCGIVGYVGPRPPVDRERLAAMRDTLAHRGPDGAGLWTHADARCAVGLAHRRLAIVDRGPAGAQPMAHAGLRVAFNGEIYGHAALRRALEDEGHRFASRCDTEVIPALYRARGLGLLDALDGMFAFALWDPAARRLLLARDRLGIKPLFIAEAGGGLMFASETKALLAAGTLDRAIDPQALHDYLGLTYVPGPRTLLRAVRQLPPGHAIEWRDGRVRQWRYWRPVMASSRLRPPDPPPPPAEAAAGIRGALVEAVRARLMGEVPVGVFLSGGLDSAAILWAMREAGAALPAFTIRFDDARFDESRQAAATARALGARHHVETVRPDPAAIVDALAPAMDQPFADSSAIPLWHLCRVARRHVTVALGGDGGDEVFAGYRTHVAWWLAKAWRRLPARVREDLAPALAARLPVRHGKVGLDVKARAFVDAASRPPIEAHARFKQFLSEGIRHDLMPSTMPYHMPPDAIRPTARLFERAARDPGAGDGLDAILAADLAVYLPDDILVKADRMSMLHGLELRVPFLDHRLVESAARLPATHKLRGPITKLALRRALWGRLPTAVLTRRKAGFNVPMAAWLLGPLAPLLDELLAPAALRRSGLLDPAPVGRLIAEHRARHVDHSRALWAMLCLMLFDRHHREPRS